MKKVTIEFDILPGYHSQANVQRALRSLDLALALRSVGEEIFRPMRKHGYDDPRLQELQEDEQVCEAVSLLEQRFYALLEDRNLDLEELV